MTTSRRLWVLGGALVLTLAAVAIVDDGDEPAQLKKSAQATARRELSKGALVSGSGERANSSKFTEVMPADLYRDDYASATDNLFPARNWRPPPQSPQPRQAKPLAPALPFTYLGKLLEGERTVVFLLQEQRSLTVREGDVLDGTYRVERLTPQSMVLVYLPLNQKQSLEFGYTN